MCPLYTHATPMLQCIGPCNLFGRIWSMFTYNTCSVKTIIYWRLDTCPLTRLSFKLAYTILLVTWLDMYIWYHLVPFQEQCTSVWAELKVFIQTMMWLYVFNYRQKSEIIHSSHILTFPFFEIILIWFQTWLICV